MYTISDKRKIADWVKTKNKAKLRNPIVCSYCELSWCPIYTKPLAKGQYKTTCSIECTHNLQKKLGSDVMNEKWKNSRSEMIEISSYAGRCSAIKTVRRSQDEIKLFEYCKAEFVDVRSNYIITESWDADIFISDLNLAVLWNGPWHYRQMPHKNHSLLQVTTRDRIKVNKFQDLGYKILIFEDRYYTPELAFDKIKEFAAECDGSTEGS